MPTRTEWLRLAVGLLLLAGTAPGLVWAQPPGGAATSTNYVPKADVTITRAGREVKSYFAAADTDTARGAVLATAFTALAAGDTLHIGPGTFTTASGFAFPSGVEISGTGHATCIKYASATNTATKLLRNADTTDGNSNFNIHDLRIDGNNTDNTNVSFAQNGIDLVKCTSFIVRNCWIEHLGRNGTASCIGIRPASCTDGVISGNILSDCVDAINTSDNGSGVPCSRLSITGNIITSTNRDHAINLFHCTDSVVAGNVLRNGVVGGATPAACIRLGSNCLRNIIANNQIQESKAGHGIHLQPSTGSCADNLIMGNTVHGAALYGIKVEAAAGTSNKLFYNDLNAAGTSGDISLDAAALSIGNITAANLTDPGNLVLAADLAILNAATHVNTASALVRRDASGNFAAGTITAALAGNASTATDLASSSTLVVGAGMVRLTGVKFVRVYVGNSTSGDNDSSYTVPVGKRALWSRNNFMNLNGSSSDLGYPTVKVSGTYWPLANTTSTGNGAQSASVLQASYIAEAGETLAWNHTVTGVNSWATVIEFDNTCKLRSVPVRGLANGANTIYTCGSAGGAYLIDGGSLPSATTTTLMYVNDAHGTRTVSVNVVPSGGSAATANQASAATSVSASGRQNFTIPVTMASGDAIVVTTNSAGSGAQWAWVNVVEVQ